MLELSDCQGCTLRKVGRKRGAAGRRSLFIEGAALVADGGGAREDYEVNAIDWSDPFGVETSSPSKLSPLQPGTLRFKVEALLAQILSGAGALRCALK